MAQHRTRRSSLVTAAAAAAATTALVAALPAAASAAPSPTVQPRGGTVAAPTTTALTSGAAQAAVERGTPVDKAVQSYWTVARMAAATPLDVSLSKAEASSLGRALAASSRRTAGPAGSVAGTAAVRSAARPALAQPVPTGSSATQWPWRFSAPASTTGRVFFTMHHANGAVWRNSSCSGSVVNSEAKNLVVTAAHCLHRGKGFGFHSNWVFVPDYRSGQEPFGRYTLSVGRVTPQWVSQPWPASAQWDVAMVATRSPNAVRLADRVGSQGIAWNQPKHFHAWSLGYPADPPFDGSDMRYCNGSTYNDPWPSGANLGIDCNHTGGASGGPWLRSPDSRWIGWVNSVNSYKYDTDPSRIFGPYFGNEVGTMYGQMRNVG